MSQLLPILIFPLLGALFNGFVAMRQAQGKGFVGKSLTSIVACLMPALAFLFSLKVFFSLLAHPEITQISAAGLMEWMRAGTLLVNFGFVVDHQSALMLLVITGVGSLIHLYSTGYMHEDEAYARYMAYLNLFLFFMLILVMGDSLPVMFIGWEGVGLCSYLLIGFWFTDADKAKAGKKAFVVNRVGDLAFLTAMFLIFVTLSKDATEASELLSFASLRTNAEALKPAAGLITLCLFLGATGKSAQIPLYVWLPDAMAGPTPVSALIHAATMVTAGIFMIAKLSFLFVMAPAVMHLIATIGLATALMAALIGLTQYDIKKVLAYSTVSQLGFMFLALGVGAFNAAMFHVMTHAFFKACLFLGAGSVIHGMHHEQDIRRMGGLWHRMPTTAVTFLLATLAISGFPLTAGFFSKDEILYLVYASDLSKLYYGLAVLTAGITAFYMMRLFAYAFLGASRAAHPEHIHESPRVMTVPLIILAGFSLVGGFMGVPHVLGHSLGIENWLAHWLASLGQVTPHEVAGPLQEGALMVISTVWALSCSAAAYFIYRSNLNAAANLKVRLAPLYQLITNKFYIDEIYDALIIKPVKRISDLVLYRNIDVRLIDGLAVNGVGAITRLLGNGFSLFQSGVVGHYMFYFLIGLCLFLGYMVMG
jgi:NADH-quinone oxidoreductase subunit L